MAMYVQKILKRLKMFRVHDSLSAVTNKRKACMPWEGTFDFWILLAITLMNLAAVGIGLHKLSVGTDVEGRPWDQPVSVSYTHLTLPTILLV